MGVKLVSFGFAGQGRAIMRGPMVSGVINQLLTTAEWYAILFYTTKEKYLLILLLFIFIIRLLKFILQKLLKIKHYCLQGH